ncbi:hypothetical protein NHX12_021736 [Muraenolepis orangiensis]|uniref:Extended synaptotagmin-2 n=1 Tax=Muraenolepis orangiensis TaxID=630683 RepID=A0A9Q0EQH5_9TELE|nr:hypothetical protein NHX12_021736 [Muraenolepis orangiensis]
MLWSEISFTLQLLWSEISFTIQLLWSEISFTLQLLWSEISFTLQLLWSEISFTLQLLWSEISFTLQLLWSEISFTLQLLWSEISFTLQLLWSEISFTLQLLWSEISFTLQLLWSEISFTLQLLWSEISFTLQLLWSEISFTLQLLWSEISFTLQLLWSEISFTLQQTHGQLSSFCFTNINLGDKPLRINGVKVYNENVDKHQIIMDLQVSFVGTTAVDVEVKRFFCRAGIKSIQLHGVLRVLMEPLLGDMPLVGALSLFFLKRPLLDITWTGLTNILDIPGLSGFSESVIQDLIFSYLVLPNRITIPLVGDMELSQLRYPMPKGILRIHFLEAQDLEGKDQFLGGLIKAKSDPYGILQIGTQLFQSRTIKGNLHPKWNQVFEALVYEVSGQHLEIELLMMDLSQLHQEQKVDEWFDLEEAPTGKLHLKLEWLSLLSTPEKMDQVLRSVRADRSLANEGLSSALLMVYLDSAKNLPVSWNLQGNVSLGERRASGLVFLEAPASGPQRLLSSLSDLNDGAKQVSVFKTLKTLDSKVRYKTREPLWEEAFSFLVHDPRRQELEVEVLSLEKQDCSDQPSAIKVRKTGAPGSVSALGCNPLCGSQQRLGLTQSSQSLASEASLPGAHLDLQNRLLLLHKSGPPVQLTLRHSSPRNKLIVVVHACRHLLAFNRDSSDPFLRLYLLPDRSRGGRRKTSVMKRNLNPVYDQTFEFSVSMVELHRRSLDVAVKNGGRVLSKNKGLLGKVLVDLSGEDISKGWTQWYTLTDGGSKT